VCAYTWSSVMMMACFRRYGYFANPTAASCAAGDKPSGRPQDWVGAGRSTPPPPPAPPAPVVPYLLGANLTVVVRLQHPSFPCALMVDPPSVSAPALALSLTHAYTHARSRTCTHTPLSGVHCGGSHHVLLPRGRWRRVSLSIATLSLAGGSPASLVGHIHSPAMRLTLGRCTHCYLANRPRMRLVPWWHRTPSLPPAPTGRPGWSPASTSRRPPLAPVQRWCWTGKMYVIPSPWVVVYVCFV
jgi:hypothetical protein